MSKFAAAQKLSEVVVRKECEELQGGFGGPMKHHWVMVEPCLAKCCVGGTNG